MAEYLQGGSLDEAYRKQPQGSCWCKCDNCKLIYEDDVPFVGSLFCPQCHDDALVRGLECDEVRLLLGFLPYEHL